MIGAAGQKRVSSRFLNYISIWLPTLQEQRHIVAYLDKTCKLIDDVAQIRRQQLDTLAQLRKSLIHECVTGKRRVTAADSQQVKGHV